MIASFSGWVRSVGGGDFAGSERRMVSVSP